MARVGGERKWNENEEAFREWMDLLGKPGGKRRKEKKEKKSKILPPFLRIAFLPLSGAGWVHDGGRMFPASVSSVDSLFLSTPLLFMASVGVCVMDTLGGLFLLFCACSSRIRGIRGSLSGYREDF